jgi:hypothetical protein
MGNEGGGGTLAYPADVRGSDACGYRGSTRHPWLTPLGRRLAKSYALQQAYRFPCCEAVPIGGNWEMYGVGPRRAYSVIVDVYWGSRPTNATRAAAQRAIETLRLPRAR